MTRRYAHPRMAAESCRREITDWQRNPSKRGLCRKNASHFKSRAWGGAAKRNQKNGAPGEIRTPDLLLRSYSWPNWPGLGQGVSGCKHQIGERFSPLPTTPSKPVVATVSATVVPGSPARIWQTKLQPDDSFASPVQVRSHRQKS
jgi:hypothetical protein